MESFIIITSVNQIINKTNQNNGYHIFSTKLLISKGVKCGRLRKPSYGMITPSSCSESKQVLGAQCAFACKPGFKLMGASIRLIGQPSVLSIFIYSVIFLVSKLSIYKTATKLSFFSSSCFLVFISIVLARL